MSHIKPEIRQLNTRDEYALVNDFIKRTGDAPNNLALLPTQGFSQHKTFNLVAWVDQTVVGLARIHCGWRDDFHHASHLHLLQTILTCHKLALVSLFMIDMLYKQTDLAVRLHIACLKLCLLERVHYLLAEYCPRLQRLLQHLGFAGHDRRLQQQVIAPDRVMMLVDLTNVEY